MSKNWEKSLVAPTTTLRDALFVINSQALRIVLVTGADRALLGVLTDGDIRRALLSNASLDDSVIHFMNNKPVIASPTQTRAELLEQMKHSSILSIPIVDDAGKLIGLESWEKASSHRRHDNPIFIMAGGFGSRLKPLTDNCPKPMLNVGGKPMLEILLERFIKAGFHNFYFSTHYLPEIIRNHFGNGSKWNVSISYVHEDSPLGTGGALGLLPDDIINKPLILINGDILTTLDFERLLNFHDANHSIATMCVRQYEYQIPYGVIHSDGNKILEMQEKPIHRYFVNAGIYVLNPELYKSVSKNIKIDMPTLLESQIEQSHDVLMFPIHEYWLDIGRMDDFNRAQQDINQLEL